LDWVLQPEIAWATGGRGQVQEKVVEDRADAQAGVKLESEDEGDLNALASADYFPVRP
jgi:hypothetical protein